MSSSDIGTNCCSGWLRIVSILKNTKQKPRWCVFIFRGDGTMLRKNVPLWEGIYSNDNPTTQMFMEISQTPSLRSSTICRFPTPVFHMCNCFFLYSDKFLRLTTSFLLIYIVDKELKVQMNRATMSYGCYDLWYWSEISASPNQHRMITILKESLHAYK